MLHIIEEVETLLGKLKEALTSLPGVTKAVDDVDDVEDAISAGVSYLKTNVPAAAIKLGEDVLLGAVHGASWSVLAADLLKQTEAAGIQLLEDAATIALNFAQSNLLAQGKITAPTPAVADPVSTTA